ncbi:MAG: hypothetical protein WCE21_00250 [Candidatus Babeliales bacterium]
MKRHYNVLAIFMLLCLGLRSSDDQLVAQQLYAGNIRSHCKLHLKLGQAKAVFSKTLRFIASEQALFNADRFLGLNLVPTTIIKEETDADNTKEICSCHVWIEQDSTPICSSTQLKKTVTPTEWSGMNIFYFLFGQYDRHFGNIIIEKDTKKLYLIDNEAVTNQQHVSAYSPDKKLSCAWVGNIGSYTAQIPVEHANSETFIALLACQQPPETIKKAFPSVDEWTNHDIDNGYCRVWQDKLWRQLYASDEYYYMDAPFASSIASDLLHKLHSLTATDIEEFWPPLPEGMSEKAQQEYAQCITDFVARTLERRDMIISYFKQHPEGVQED